MNWVGRWWLALGLGLALLLGPASAQRQALPQAPTPGGIELVSSAQLAVSTWTRAELDEWWRQLSAVSGSGRPLAGSLLPPADPAAWSTVVLPQVHRHRVGGARLDRPEYQMRWYRLSFKSNAQQLQSALALYMPRMRALPSALLVRTGSGWLPVFDNQFQAREQWVRPILATLPGSLNEQLQGEQAVELVLAVPVLSDVAFMVPSVSLGARAELAPVHHLRWALQIGVPQGTTLMLLVLGLFAFSVWLRRRAEPAYLLAALLALASMFRHLHYHIDMPRDALAFDWFWWATHASMAWVMLFAFLLALHFMDRRYLRFERFLAVFVAASSLLTMPLWAHPVDPVLAQHLVNGLVAVGGTAFVVYQAWRSRNRELFVIACGLMVAVGLGVHDLLMLAGLAWPEHVSLLPYGTLTTVACFLAAVQHRFVDALGRAEQAKDQLGERLREQGSQLQSQHEQLRESERQQALLLERQRLMQEMHDGLGSSLLSAMVAVEQGRMQQHQVVEVLRECVDDLRLVIDSLEPVGHDLVSLLATMRYRLGKRLQAGGLTLDWDVQDLPPLAWLEPPDALHVLRLLQEALNNVLKHARATRVRIATRHLGGKVEIRVEDDGEGFDLATVQKGRGLRSQLKRAQRLGGSVLVDTQPGHGTRLTLRLPVERPAAPEPAA